MKQISIFLIVNLCLLISVTIIGSSHQRRSTDYRNRLQSNIFLSPLLSNATCKRTTTPKPPPGTYTNRLRSNIFLSPLLSTTTTSRTYVDRLRSNIFLSPLLSTTAPSILSRTASARPNDGRWVASLPTATTCGKKGFTSLIIGGIDVEEGEFPWMVALFHFTNKEKTKIKYTCGGSLISNTVIITAAHCTKNQEQVYLQLGRHNLYDQDEKGYIRRFSREIHTHPDYTSGAHGDVALVLMERVEFTPKIQPICLWAQGTNLDKIVLRVGTVTGWGRIENDGDFSSTPMKLNIRTVGLETCRNSNEKLRDIATDKTFCAGGNHKGPCHGDSGSGFYVRHGDVFYLRGIVSTSIGDHWSCNLSEYAVYVDLAYYLDWIRLYLRVSSP